MEPEPIVTTVIAGTPIAVLVTIVGLIWQAGYAYFRDRIAEKQHKLELKLEKAKFEHQAEIEKLRFEYDQRHWREELGRELTIKLLNERIIAFADLWRLLQVIATHRKRDLTPGETKDLAAQVLTWRYSKGGLLAENTTREAAYTFQSALWAYDGSSHGYREIRRARKLVTRSLRADLGLGENISGETIYQITEQRQRIRQELAAIQHDLKINASAE